MRPGVELTPRKQWPSGLAKLGVEMSGKIGDGPATGRAIGRLTDLGWGARLRRLLDEPDGEASDDVVAAAVKVLASWDWAERPTAVMALDSDRHPLLISSLSRELARLGRLTDLGTLQYAPTRRAVTAANSAYRVAALQGAWTPPDPDVIASAGGPVLLVDDLSDSGWTLTMAARVVREAGAPEVLPFALASTS
jgi:ATP-dependent DNA helicase RecQ